MADEPVVNPPSSVEAESLVQLQALSPAQAVAPIDSVSSPVEEDSNVVDAATSTRPMPLPLVSASASSSEGTAAPTNVTLPGLPNSVTPAMTLLFWCNDCRRIVGPTPVLNCPHCNSSSVEVIEFVPAGGQTGFRSFLHMISLVRLLADARRSNDQDFAFNVVYLVGGNGGEEPSETDILSFLMDQPSHPVRPAKKEAFEKFPFEAITQEEVSEQLKCTICMDEFVLDEKAKTLPCTHKFHEPCILPWFEAHNSCPLCRYEVESEDPPKPPEQGPPLLLPGMMPGGGDTATGLGIPGIGNLGLAGLAGSNADASGGSSNDEIDGVIADTSDEDEEEDGVVAGLASSRRLLGLGPNSGLDLNFTLPGMVSGDGPMRDGDSPFRSLVLSDSEVFTSSGEENDSGGELESNSGSETEDNPSRGRAESPGDGLADSYRLFGFLDFDTPDLSESSSGDDDAEGHDVDEVLRGFTGVGPTTLEWNDELENFVNDIGTAASANEEEGVEPLPVERSVEGSASGPPAPGPEASHQPVDITDGEDTAVDLPALPVVDKAPERDNSTIEEEPKEPEHRGQEDSSPPAAETTTSDSSNSSQSGPFIGVPAQLSRRPSSGQRRLPAMDAAPAAPVFPPSPPAVIRNAVPPAHRMNRLRPLGSQDPAVDLVREKIEQDAVSGGSSSNDSGSSRSSSPSGQTLSSVELSTSISSTNSSMAEVLRAARSEVNGEAEFPAPRLRAAPVVASTAANLTRTRSSPLLLRGTAPANRLAPAGAPRRRPSDNTMRFPVLGPRRMSHQALHARNVIGSQAMRPLRNIRAPRG